MSAGGEEVVWVASRGNGSWVGGRNLWLVECALGGGRLGDRAGERVTGIASTVVGFEVGGGSRCG